MKFFSVMLVLTLLVGCRLFEGSANTEVNDAQIDFATNDATDAADPVDADLGPEDISTEDVIADLPLQECDDAWVVAPNAAPDGEGTIGSPTNLAIAAQSVGDGGCIRLRPGIYRTASEVFFSANDLTIRADPEAVVEIQTNSGWIIDGNRVEVRDVTFVGGDATTIFVNGDDFGLYDSSFDAGARHLRYNARSGGVVSGCQFGTYTLMAMLIVNNRGLSFTENLFHDWTISGSTPIQVTGGSNLVTFERNRFENMSGGAGVLGFGATCTSNGCEAAINFSARNLLAQNNVFSNVERAIEFYGCEDCTFEHNTIITTSSMTPTIKLSFATVNGVDIYSSGTRIFNNVVFNPAGNMTQSYQINDPAGEGLQIDGNLYWNGGNAVPTIPGEEFEPIIANPMFDASSPFDFVLSPLSPAIDAGATRSVNVDFFGSSRPVNGRLDIGAHEYATP